MLLSHQAVLWSTERRRGRGRRAMWCLPCLPVRSRRWWPVL